jgi:MFS family permease
LVRFRLALLMFLEYAPLGATIPLFSLHLKEIGFSPQQIGWCWATQAMGAIVGPPLLGQFADRWFPAQRCLAVSCILAGLLYWLLADLTSIWFVFPTALALWLLAFPTTPLVTSLCFANLRASHKEFGTIRVWGTLSWGLTCILLGIWLRQPDWLQSWTGFSGPRPLSDIFRIAAILSVCLGFYALTLPHTPPRPWGNYRFALMGAVQLFRLPSFVLTWIVAIGIGLTTPFYQQMTPLLLDSLGARDSSISMLLSLGQLLEVAGLILHARLLAAWGYRGLMLLGIAAWTFMMLLDIIGRPFELVVGGLLMNGISISCFTVTAQLYCNRLSHSHFRASAQALLSLTSGVAMLVGSVLAGIIHDRTSGRFPPVYATAAAVMLASLAIFAWGFREEA